MISYFEEGLRNEATSANIRSALETTLKVKGQGNLEDLADLVATFLKGIPAALSVALVMTRDPRCGRAVSFAVGQVLKYLVDEEDLFPEDRYGVLGLIDDAYITHSLTMTLMQTFTYVDIGSVSYKAPDKTTLDVIRTLLPNGIPQALDHTCRNMVHVASSLFLTGTQEDRNQAIDASDLRIVEAQALLSSHK